MGRTDPEATTPAPRKAISNFFLHFYRGHPHRIIARRILGRVSGNQMAGSPENELDTHQNRQGDKSEGNRSLSENLPPFPVPSPTALTFTSFATFISFAAFHPLIRSTRLLVSTQSTSLKHYRILRRERICLCSTATTINPLRERPDNQLKWLL